MKKVNLNKKCKQKFKILMKFYKDKKHRIKIYKIKIIYKNKKY